MIVKQTTLFAKQKKKLHSNQIQFLDHVVEVISKNPNIGAQKKGDLNHIRIYKFKISQEYLLAYSHLNSQIILHSLRPHENFY